MQKTTVYLDEQAYREIKRIAQRSHRSPAELVRDAVAEYAARHGQRDLPRGIGKFHSRLPPIDWNNEDYLAGFGEDGIR